MNDVDQAKLFAALLAVLKKENSSLKKQLMAELHEQLQTIDTPNITQIIEQGEPGPQGERGEKGETGERGIQGSKGDKGDKGDKGEPGEKGDQGEKGEQGLQGEKGDPGLDGIKGDKGDKGDRGEKGKDGEPGLKGDKGDRGEKGPTGSKGDKGDKGPKGDKGDKGSQGLKGPKGEKGPKGPKGDKGEKGPQGPKGDKGSKGAKGDTGPAGKDGVNFDSDTFYKEFNTYKARLNQQLSTIGGGGSTKILDNDDVEFKRRHEVEGDAILIFDSAKQLFVSESFNDIIERLQVGMEIQYDRLVDANGSFTYIGEALPGSDRASASWRIKRVYEQGDDIEIIWAANTAAFDRIWNDRETYEYN